MPIGTPIDHADERGAEHQRQRLDRRLPVAEVDDEQQAEDDDDGEHDRAVQEPGDEPRRARSGRAAGTTSRTAVRPSMTAPSTQEMKSKKPWAWSLRKSTNGLQPGAERDLVVGEPVVHARPQPIAVGAVDGASRSRKPGRPRWSDRDQSPRLFLTASRPGLPSKVVTPSSQASSAVGIGLQPRLGGLRRLLAVVQDRAHDLVLHRQGELQVLEKLADVRAFADDSRRGRW